MENGRIHIEEILERYFEGTAGKSEVKMAEDYLLMHPEYMEAFEDRWNLRLEEQENEFFPEEILYKSFSDLDEGQMMLLAAAAAEGDISSEETTALFESINDRFPGKISVSDFKNLKLKPFNEGFRHKSRLLKVNPMARSLRRGAISMLAAAAVITIFIISAPLSRKETNNIIPATYVAASVTKHTTGAEAIQGKSMAVFQPSGKSPERRPLRSETRPAPAETVSAEVITETVTAIDLSERQPLIPTIASSGDVRPVLAYANVMAGENKPLNATKENWMIKGLTGAISSISNFGKADDKFEIADKSIKEINKLLGWNMQLEKVAAADGDREAITFRSDLVSFSKPIKKKQ